MSRISDSIKEYCCDQGLDYREDYSGRGMYGETCVGITCDNPLQELKELFAYIIDEGDDWSGYEVSNMLGEPKMDGMGMEKILYFPKLRTEIVL